MYLGIDQQTDLVYEGLDGPVLPVVPRPTVTQAKLIKREDWNELPTGIAHISDVVGFPGGYIRSRHANATRAAFPA